MSEKSASKAVFTTGSTMRHVVVMTATSSVGLVSIFAVDALNLFYISLLGQQELAAAIGYAATIMFFSISFCIGIAIAAAALVGRALGAENAERAKSMATWSLIYMFLLGVVIAAVAYPLLPFFLSIIGAEGETLELSLRFMQIVIPSIPLLGLGMCMGALLRAKGDPRRAMYVTLSGGAAALVLDPLFIFGLDMGLNGAAIATFCVRIVLVVVGLWGVHSVHKMLGKPKLQDGMGNLKAFFTIAIPATVTQLATPIGNAYVTSAIAEFGDDAVAGWAIVGRLLPVAFGVIFALSGSVGPIMSQNYGAKLLPRVQSTLRDGLIFTLIYCTIVWAFLAIANPWIIQLFGAKNQAADIISIFNWLVAGSFLFNGALFVANAAFNNLGFPLWATFFNWGRATAGVIPFVYVGKSYGATGVLMGWGLGAIVFGIGSVIVAFRVVSNLPMNDDEHDSASVSPPPSSNSPFTSGKGAS
jgi:putative MATE family efflux protein